MAHIARGTPAFRRVAMGIAAGGFSTFGLLYCTQALLPSFSRLFDVTPAQASLTVSATTIGLGVTLLLTAPLSQRYGRKICMVVSLFASALAAILSGAAPTFATLLAVRALEGVALAGFPSIVIAYLGEEVEARSVGFAVGMCISANTIGGMGGRLITAAVADASSWRTALVVLGCIGLACATIVTVVLPPSRNFHPKPLSVAGTLAAYRRVLRDPALLALYGLSMLLMGAFITVYNYLGYKLEAPPYNLSPTLVGYVFTLYLVGTFSSTWAGGLADRLGRRRIVLVATLGMLAGALLLLARPLPLLVLGIGVMTFSFFCAHSLASSWVGVRAGELKGHATSLFLLCYYAGSSTIGSLDGIFYNAHGWNATIAIVSLIILAGFGLALVLTRLKPIVAVGRAARREAAALVAESVS